MNPLNPQTPEQQAQQARDDFLNRVSIDDALETLYAEIDSTFSKLRIRVEGEQYFLKEKQNATQKTR
jgi:CII-binding regulator of phage lambda lysogenization HflD